LARWFPAAAARLPRVALTDLPTPVERATALGAATGLDVWIKRDDRSAAAYGGNKPRKLEYVLGAARQRGARRLVTFGGLGTHHGLATTLFGRAHGLPTTLVLLPQPVTPAVRRTLLLAHAFGAELYWARGVAGIAATALGVLARAAARGDRPYVVAAGGSSVAGTLGFVGAALELAEQVRDGVLPAPDVVYVAVGTGGTLAGLALGLRLAGLPTRVAGVLVTDIVPPSPRRVSALAGRALRVLRRFDPQVPPVVLTPDDLGIATEFVGPGYGASTPAAVRAQALLAATEGIRIETTYTAKCLAALLAGAERGRRLLFWNTFSAVEPVPPGGVLPAPPDLPPSFQRFFRDDG
jgi:D-cysteine desulfhydrase